MAMRSHGMILGLIPYDFRMPTPRRFRERMWNTQSARILAPRVFGIGWTLNLHALKGKSRPAFYAALVLYAATAVNMALSLRRGFKRLTRAV